MCLAAQAFEPTRIGITKIAIVKQAEGVYVGHNILRNRPVKKSCAFTAIAFSALLATAGCGGRSAQYGEPYYPPQRQATCYHPESPSEAETQLAMMAAKGTNPNASGLLMSYRAQREQRERTCQ